MHRPRPPRSQEPGAHHPEAPGAARRTERQVGSGGGWQQRRPLAWQRCELAAAVTCCSGQDAAQVSRALVGGQLRRLVRPGVVEKGDSSRACECTPSTPYAHAPFCLSASYACFTRRAPVLVVLSPLVLRSLSLRHPRTDASSPARTARPPRRARTPRTPRPSPTHSSTTFFPFCTPPAPVPATHGRRVLALPMPPSPCTAGGFATLRTHFSSR
jgi:hypothetical protein